MCSRTDLGDSEQCKDDAIPHSRMIGASLLLSLLSDCKYAVWTDAILRPDNYFHNRLEMPCLAVVSHGNVTTPACVLACAHNFYLHDCGDAVRTDSGDVD